MNPAPPPLAELAQAEALSPRPARNDFRGAGKWLSAIALAVLIAGFVVYRLMLGEGQDGYGLLFFSVAAVTLAIAGPLGLIGAVLWLLGVARAGRARS